MVNYSKAYCHNICIEVYNNALYGESNKANGVIVNHYRFYQCEREGVLGVLQIERIKLDNETRKLKKVLYILVDSFFFF